ncbi:MAG TPA: homoserine kinase [Candidatus Obscuribacterales bacterium]
MVKSASEMESSILKSLTLRIPGSTSNLGPGFDTLALALNIYTTVRFDVLEQPDVSRPIVTLKGAIAHLSGSQNQGDLIYHMLSELWQSDHDLLQRVRVTVSSDIPLGCGLGSSGAAILGAVWASYALKGLIPTRRDILTEGMRLEGYPENVAASLMGNLVVCGPQADDKIIVAEQLNWPPRWCVIAVVPRYTLTTQAARSVLPKKVAFEDAVANVQRTALAVAAISNADESLLKLVLRDRLHEPYREQLVPELDLVRRLLAGFPIIGCFLSGAGSSVVVLVNERHRPEVLDELSSWAEGQAHPPAVLDLQVDKEGIQEVETA